MTVFGHIWLPINFDRPVPVGVVDDGEILSDFPSGGYVHFKDRFEWFGLDSEDDAVSTNICFRLVVKDDKIVEFVDWVFTQNGERNFVFEVNQLLLIVGFILVGFILVILGFFILHSFLIQPDRLLGGDECIWRN